MPIDSHALRQHYASLSDEELLALDRGELTEVARNCYDQEFTKRNLGAAEAEPETVDGQPAVPMMDVAGDWLEDAATACSFSDAPGSSNTPDAEDARRALEEAGIPCRIQAHDIDEEARPRRTYHEYRVLVPGPTPRRSWTGTCSTATRRRNGAGTSPLCPMTI